MGPERCHCVIDVACRVDSKVRSGLCCLALVLIHTNNDDVLVEDYCFSSEREELLNVEDIMPDASDEAKIMEHR